MAEVILMPRLSDTMTEGVIAAWHKKVGDTVKKGDLLAEVETDKATMELESYQDGTLLYVGAQNGEKVDVNALLAILGKPGENVDDLVKQNGGQAATAAENKTEAPKEEAQTADAPKAEKPAASGMDLATVEEAIDATLSGFDVLHVLICHATTASNTGTNNKPAAVTLTTMRRAVWRAASVRSATASF